jgi:hypothetical protein
MASLPVLSGEQKDAELNKAAVESHNKALELLSKNPGKEQAGMALLMLHTAADTGLTPSKIKLAELYYLGVDGVEKNIDAALPFVRELALAGNPWALNTFGSMHEFGQGVDRSRTSALHWYRESALKAYPRAMFNVGRLLRSGPPKDQNPIEGVAWLRLAAEYGDTPAKNTIEDISAALTPQQKEVIQRRLEELRESVEP